MPVYRQQKKRVLLLVATGVVSLLALFFMQPLAQSLAYHDFSDQQSLFGINNFWNVISNIPFLLVGVAGLGLCIGNADLGERLSWGILFASVSFVAFGSSYYHLSPDNATLVWDRLPMAIAFMGLFVALLSEYADDRAQKYLLVPFLALGVFAVGYWAIFDDLRFYIWVQFFPLVSIVLMLLLFDGRYDQKLYIWVALFFYVLAKWLEYADDQIYIATGELIGGHPIKHLMSAAGIFLLYKMLQQRRLA